MDSTHPACRMSTQSNKISYFSVKILDFYSQDLCRIFFTLNFRTGTESFLGTGHHSTRKFLSGFVSPANGLGYRLLIGFCWQSQLQRHIWRAFKKLLHQTLEAFKHSLLFPIARCFDTSWSGVMRELCHRLPSLKSNLTTFESH